MSVVGPLDRLVRRFSSIVIRQYWLIDWLLTFSSLSLTADLFKEVGHLVGVSLCET